MGREQEEAGRTVRPHSSDPCEGNGRGGGTREGREEGKRTRRGGGEEGTEIREEGRYELDSSVSLRTCQQGPVNLQGSHAVALDKPTGDLRALSAPQTQVISPSSLTHFLLAFRRPHSLGFPPTSLAALL